jgi:hypothetical protein
MSGTQQQPLIDHQRLRQEFEERLNSYIRHPRSEQAKFVSRAKMHIVHNYVKQAEVGGFKVLIDEAPPMGTGLGPRPLQYLLVGVGA